jgi:hypothetical protein
MKVIPPPPSPQQILSIIPLERRATTRSPIGHAFHPPQASNIPPNFCRHKQGRCSVPRPIHRTKRGPRRLIVVWLIFRTGIDGSIWSFRCDLARVSNPPAGRILPRICTLLNSAVSPSPVGIGSHRSTTTSIMVLQWGGLGGFALLHP